MDTGNRGDEPWATEQEKLGFWYRNALQEIVFTEWVPWLSPHVPAAEIQEILLAWDLPNNPNHTKRLVGFAKEINKWVMRVAKEINTEPPHSATALWAAWMREWVDSVESKKRDTDE